MQTFNFWTGSNIGTGWSVWTGVNVWTWNWIWFTFKPKNQNTYTSKDVTYNKDYPWFDKNDYEILVRMANKSWKTGQAKKDLMDELYMQYYPQVMNKHNLDERQTVMKEQAYQTKDSQWDEKAQQQTQIKIADLAQKAKKKFWIDATTPDDEVINAMIKWIPNGWKLFEDYINKWDKTLLYEAWIEDQSFMDMVWQQATNIVWWAYDSATWLPRFLAKWAADVIWWTAKQLWADEDKVSNLVQSYKDYLDTNWSAQEIWADQDSIAYNVTKTVWDLAQVAGWEWLIKWAIWWTAKGSQLLNYMKNAPTWQKMIAWWVEWAWDMALYSIVSEWKLPTTEEEAIWAWIWALLPWWWALYKAGKPYLKKWLDKAAAQLELSGLLNPAKLNTIKNQLVNEWTDLAKAWLKGWEAEDVWTWMIERGFKWDKTKIIEDLWNYAKKSHDLKREVLWASDTLHTVESANKSLQAIRSTIDWVPWLENKLARVDELLAKWKHTLSELDEIKSILDDTIDIYTNAWDVRAWAVKEWLDKVRKDLRKYIEDAAEKEWLGNIKLLNNETQVSNSLKDAISRKDSADAAREMLSVFSKSAIWWAAWYNVWPFDTDTRGWKLWNIIIWALAWKYVFSTKSKTQLASLLNKISWGSRKELERLVAWDLAVKDLSKSTREELVDIFNKVWPNWAKTPKEFEQMEYEALLKKYSYWDVPALEFKEGVDDAWKTILAWSDDKIIGTPYWTNLREWKIGEINKIDNKINDELSKLNPEKHEDYMNYINNKWKEYNENDVTSWFWDKAEDFEAYSKYKQMESEYAKKWEKWTLDYQLKKIKDWTYQQAKKDYDNFLDEAAKETWWIAIKAPLKNVKPSWEYNGKWLVRVLEKAFKKGDWVDGITDIVRWTIWAKDRKHMEEIIKRAESKWYEVDKWKFTQPTTMWYSDASFLFTSPNWIKAEVQINYPEMMVAKEWKWAIEMWIINEADYNALLKKLWVEWWLWHKYYEDWRTISDKLESGLIKWKKNIKKAEEEMEQIAEKSREYYKKFYK